MASIQKRTNTNGEITYRVQIRLKGHPPITATFVRLTDARRWEQQTEAAIKEGRYFKTTEARKRTMADAIDRYNSEVLAHRRNPVNQKIYLAYWKEAIGDYLMADISAALIAEHRNNLVGKKNRYGRVIGTATANRYTQALGHVLNVAIKEWEWINQNPVERIQKYKEPRGRVRFLSDEERERLLVSCRQSDNPYLYKIVVLAISTGARKMEIIDLKWPDVDLNRGQIILHETKNEDRRVVPLKGYALDIVRELAHHKIDGCPYLFPSSKITYDTQRKPIYKSIDIRTAWENALIKAQIEDFRFHDLRHSAASYLAMNQASLTEIADVLGHKTLQMVKRYAHLSEAHTGSIVEKMNKEIWK